MTATLQKIVKVLQRIQIATSVEDCKNVTQELNNRNVVEDSLNAKNRNQSTKSQ